MKYSTLRGMDDILPENIRSWQNIESEAKKIFELYGYKEIRTPMLERTDVFTRGIGESTDIVSKEMYTFDDRKQRSLTLRPEGTAPIVRSYVQHSMHQKSQETRLFYIGPMFRSERPQKGRSRQFHQIGAELIGLDSPYADAEIMAQLNKLLLAFKVEDFEFQINSLGCKKDKDRFSQMIKGYLEDKKKDLCDDCLRRMDKNVLRVLDCKNKKCKDVVENVPDVLQSHCDECLEHFDIVRKLLKEMKVDFTVNKKLVRGLDYYTKTVFEVKHKGLGAQDAIGAGGRYNNLVKDLGGVDVGAVGYAVGLERILAVSKYHSKEIPKIVSMIGLGAKAKIEAFKLAEDIRDSFKVPVLCDLRDVSLKAQLRNADKQKSSIAVIIGDDELQKGVVVLREMDTKKQIEVPLEMALEDIKKRLQSS